MQESDQSKTKFDKVFLVKQETNLKKTWEGGEVEGDYWNSLVIDPWLIGTKYPKQIILCDTPTQ